MKDTLTPDMWTYLDNNATARLDPRVLQVMLPIFQDQFANPSSIHTPGLRATDALRKARHQVQSLIGAARESEIVFTSGGSESNNTAIFSALETQVGRDEIITSEVEHSSVLAVCAHLERSGRAKVHRIPVDQDGNLNLEAYRRTLSQKTAIASFQWANNETGVVFPVQVLASTAHQEGALFHCDAVQTAGKIPMHVQSTEIDMLSISAHKMHGPKGAGALYVRHGVRLAPLIHGGRQERGRRAGTENTAAIAGFGAAAELAAQELPYEMSRITVLRDRLQQEILRSIPHSVCIGEDCTRLPNTLNIAIEEVEADSLLLLLDRAYIAASSGSACASGSIEPSHVLRAMKVPFGYIRGSLRFSFSRQNSIRDVDRVLEVLPRLVADLRATSFSLEAAHA